ncbi:MAG: transposase [Endozoicomonadaceae bacterium]|nr:transposase [Endozoicomonadaceae bacterium]MCY4328530.1 transposase [Endozoicomonadaceae bacterium]
MYKKQSSAEVAEGLSSEFNNIFTQKTSFSTLNQTLKRLFKNKEELLLVLKRPGVPLHTNGSESDTRDYVKKKKVSGYTRSDEGRWCHDTFASLKKRAGNLEFHFGNVLVIV